MTPTTLISGAPAAAAPAAAAPAAAAPVVDAAALQARIDALTEEVAENRRTSEYWAEKARTPAAAATPVATEEEPDVLEAITTGGAKGFDALAEKRGFIKRTEVESLIDQRTNKVTQEQQLMEEYPDLKNRRSEFFSATAVAYGALVRGGMPQVLAMSAAAKQVELEFIKGGKIKLGASAQTPEEKAEAKEAARLSRIAAQAGNQGRRPSAAEEEDTELDATQLRVVRQMLVGQPGPDGKPMNEAQAIERYKSRATGGVAMRSGR